VKQTPTELRASDLFAQDRLLRIEKIRADIAKRLRKACGHLSEEDFAILVEKLTRVQLGGEGKP
jgi:hypothetical protein